MIIKNSNLRRNIFDNRYRILIVIIAIILILCLIRVLNYMAGKENNSALTNTITPKTSYKPQETIIKGSNVTQNEQEKNNKTIDTFINYCNEKQIEKAYDLLTDECKEKVFNSSIENFNNNYIQRVFNGKKTYSIQSWINNTYVTYKVRIFGDILSTGKVENAIEDYYTIVTKNNIQKLNINKYIGSKEIDSSETKSNITINVISKDIFLDYEIYNIRVDNKSEKNILLDTKQKDKSVYLSAGDIVTYRAFMYEIDDIFLTIKPQMYRRYSIKFNKSYETKYNGNSIIFTDIVEDAEKYKNIQNKLEYKERTEIEIKF